MLVPFLIQHCSLRSSATGFSHTMRTSPGINANVLKHRLAFPNRIVKDFHSTFRMRLLLEVACFASAFTAFTGRNSVLPMMDFQNPNKGVPVVT